MLAFSRSAQWIATGLVAATVIQGLRVARTVAQADWTPSALALLGGATGLVFWVLVWIWRSRTVVDAHGISQSWLWQRHAAWADVVQARILAVPGLDWLIVPRLVLRVRGRGLMSFHCADRAVLAVCAAYVVSARPPFAEKSPAEAIATPPVAHAGPGG